jgi:hypothetical protein
MKKHPPRIDMLEEKYRHTSAIITVVLFLLFFGGIIFLTPGNTDYLNTNSTGIVEKARPYLKQSCLEEEKKEEVDLLCDDIGFMGELRGHENELMWTEYEGDQQTGTFAWTISGETRDANNNFVLIIDLRMTKDGEFLRYRPTYIDYGTELKVRPKDYVSPPAPPPEALNPVMPNDAR